MGVGLMWAMSRAFPGTQSYSPWGLLPCYVFIGIADVCGWRFLRRIKKYADESFFFIRAGYNIHCTCRTQRFGGLCRVHSGPFFF